MHRLMNLAGAVTVHSPTVNTGALVFAAIAALGVMWALKRLRGFFPIIFAVVGVIALILAFAGHGL